MDFLKGDGFAALVADAAARARSFAYVADSAKIGLTLDGRIPEDQGARALTPTELTALVAAGRAGARLDPTRERGDLLVLAPTGRLRVVLGSDTAPAEGHLLGAIDWGEDRPVPLAADDDDEEHTALRTWLAGQPADQVEQRLHRIRHAVEHMAPVLLHVGARTFSNLDKFSNLPGKSLAYGATGCVLSALGATPVVRWSTSDACFVVCLNALLLSGPPVVAEEFNGAQVQPAAVEAALLRRMAAYGTRPPVRADEELGDWLETLARACATARGEAQRAGRTFYREINGINLHKVERSLSAAITFADVPPAVIGFLGWRGDLDLAGIAEPATALVDRIVASPAPEGFRSSFEGFLHEFLRVTVEAFDADVAMSRGPRDLGSLRGDPRRPLSLATRDFYCCVAPSARFADRFGPDRPGLARAMSAYSARMRFNTWHYLPHTLGISDEVPGRDDWFFAPTMPDITEWSDQHHTGHVTFGVRYAIRVPFGVVFEGAHRPGLYDLRLMRTLEPRFTLADLRSAIATSRLLAAVYQVMSEHDHVIGDFTNEWFRRFHG